MATKAARGLEWLVEELDLIPGVIDETTATRLLSLADLNPAEVTPYVRQRPDTYHRHCLARRENYELLVMTWAPGQSSAAHDHSGCLCGLKVIQGHLTERLFASGPDGLVRESSTKPAATGALLVDPGIVVHSLGNDTDALLVTVHIYSPPLPEIRRYAVSSEAPREIFVRAPHKDAKVIVIIGGGFTGTMTLANFLRLGATAKNPLHLVMVDRQAAFGEGVAYRTNDAQHLLNVPAGRMSAWPDRPDDFLAFARTRDASFQPGDFVPRKLYGHYIRETLFDAARQCGDHISVELIRDEAARLVPRAQGRWQITTAAGKSLDAELLVVALGHRPPDDPLAGQWTGPRHRFVCDPWAALVLNQISPGEPVLLLGTGLTAVDAILTLNRHERTAPIIAVSRRGLMPLAHIAPPAPAADISDLTARWLDPAGKLTALGLVRDLRIKIAAAKNVGLDWRQVIDGLRPSIAQLWQRLDRPERKKFLRRLRSFWEVHRHRMAPNIAETIAALRHKGALEIMAGALQCAVADKNGIDVTIATRSEGGSKKTIRVSWVINCSGPGVHNRHTTHAVLRPLLEQGIICEDELHLGLLTDPVGRALDKKGRPLPTLLVAGTLRKSTLWESTAVPELRQQAQSAAQTAIETLHGAVAH